MYVLLRPGPYVCAEWNLGGYPVYLMNSSERKTSLRTTNNKTHLEAVKRWIGVVT